MQRYDVITQLLIYYLEFKKNEFRRAAVGLQVKSVYLLMLTILFH